MPTALLQVHLYLFKKRSTSSCLLRLSADNFGPIRQKPLLLPLSTCGDVMRSCELCNWFENAPLSRFCLRWVGLARHPDYFEPANCQDGVVLSLASQAPEVFGKIFQKPLTGGFLFGSWFGSSLKFVRVEIQRAQRLLFFPVCAAFCSRLSKLDMARQDLLSASSRCRWL